METKAVSPLPLSTIEKLSRQLVYVLENSSFYRKKIGQSDFDLKSISKSFSGLPFTTKTELLEDQQKNPPYGSNLCVPANKIKRIHRTSGTTNTPLIIALTGQDINTTVQVGKNSFINSGLSENDTVIHCLSYNMWMGGYTDHQSLEATGAAVVPFGVGNTKNLIGTILKLKPTAIHCTPSYLAKIEMVLHEVYGLKPKDLGLKLGLFGAEPGLQNPAFRKDIEDKWGIRAMNSNYGMADVLSIFGAECQLQDGLHFMGNDIILAELINPDTLAPIAIEEDQIGELVLTNLKREAQPLIRYRTNDVVKVLSTAICKCGQTGFKFEVVGRSDDMFVVKGVNVFINALSNIIHSHMGELSGDFQIHINVNPPVDKVLLMLERQNKSISSTAFNDLHENIFNACKANLNISPEIMLLDFGGLPKTEGKTKRLFKTL